MKTALITGVTGQDGAYLTQLLLNNGYKVVGTTRSKDADLKNLKYLGISDKVIIEQCDLLNKEGVVGLIKKYQPREIYNLAAQSSVGLSFEQPGQTISFNILSVLNILESIKEFDRNIRFFQASSSEMYGAVDSLPINKDTAFHPLSPYAISKATAHWLTINYRESYGLFAVTGIMFNHESFLRGEKYFIKKIITESIEVVNGEREYVKVGNIDVKRDFGFAPDYVEAMWLSMQQDGPGDYFICTGRSLSLRSIVEYVFEKFNIPATKLVEDKHFFRPTDICDIYGDSGVTKEQLGWSCNEDFLRVLDVIIEEAVNNKKNEKNIPQG